jgi:hypothetical protein
MPISGASVAYATIGGIVLYSGIKGATIADTVRAALTGNLTVTNTEPIESLSNPNATAMATGRVVGTASGAAIANYALRYSGHAYVYGGSPGPSAENPWDCSSFVSWVLNGVGLAIPGGSWATVTSNGTKHGPTTTDYLLWSGATTIPVAYASAGCLAVWSTHIGICISNSDMISALNPSLGTAVTGISDGGPQGESVVIRRLVAA